MSKEVENKKFNTKQQIIFGLFETMMEKPYADITVKHNDKIEDTVEKIICELNRIVKNNKSV